jgi:hypothetical protein
MKHKISIEHFTYSKELVKHLHKQGHVEAWNMFDHIKSCNDLVQELIGQKQIINQKGKNYGRKSD